MIRRGFLKALFGGLCAAPVAAKAIETKEEKKNLPPMEDFSASCWAIMPDRLYGHGFTEGKLHYVTCVYDATTGTYSFVCK